MFLPALFFLGLVPLVAPPAQSANVLLIVADDLGVESVGAYGAGADLSLTPNIDRLAAQGVLFRRAWAAPLCSPSRAMLMTGRYGGRTGIGRGIIAAEDGRGDPCAQHQLLDGEITLAELLSGT